MVPLDMIAKQPHSNRNIPIKRHPLSSKTLFLEQRAQVATDQ